MRSAASAAHRMGDRSSAMPKPRGEPQSMSMLISRSRERELESGEGGVRGVRGACRGLWVSLRLAKAAQCNNKNGKETKTIASAVFLGV